MKFSSIGLSSSGGSSACRLRSSCVKAGSSCVVLAMEPQAKFGGSALCPNVPARAVEAIVPAITRGFPTMVKECEVKEEMKFREDEVRKIARSGWKDS